MHEVGALRSTTATRALIAQMSRMPQRRREKKQTQTGIRYRSTENCLWDLEDSLKFDPYRLVLHYLVLTAYASLIPGINIFK